MSHHELFLAFSALAALVSVAMWLDYFRRIDVFEKEKPVPLLIALVIGCLTPYLSLFIYRQLDALGFAENGKWANDLFYAIFGIGLNEEFSKMAGVLLVLTLLKKKVNEPIDVLVYAGVTALGFSLVENYYYFNNHGIKIISSRTFYSALEHIINTSIIVYGLYRYRLFKKGNTWMNSLTGIAIAIASHGLFDFFLLDTFTGYLAPFLSMIVYLVGINFWIQMLNNANNYSAFFDYDKIHHSSRLVSRLFVWYGLTLLIAFANNCIVADLKLALITLLYSIISDGFLFFIVILRVSRFKIFKLKYFTVRPGLPFYITKNKDEDFTFPFFNLPIKIKGESFREYLLTRYLNRKVMLHPLEEAGSFLKDTQEAMISDKHLLFDDVVVYSVSIPAVTLRKNTLLLLKPETVGRNNVGGLYPLAGLYELELPPGFTELKEMHYSSLKFLERVYLVAEE